MREVELGGKSTTRIRWGKVESGGGNKERVAAHAVEPSFVDVEGVVCFGRTG